MRNKVLYNSTEDFFFFIATRNTTCIYLLTVHCYITYKPVRSREYNYFALNFFM